jgi:L-ascorbate metabolism protein UlaG (beta-lactamase superfamily)
MSPFEAALFAKETNAELVIPIHYDNTKLPGDVKKMEEELKKNNLNYKFLKIGEIIEF